jgi:DNA-binding GntR family transcriptional regulator
MTELDDLSGVPRYLQIAGILKAEIHAGTWPPMKPAPSRVTLVERFGVAKTTVARAHANLMGCGYLVHRPGIGLLVLPADRWQSDE